MTSDKRWGQVGIGDRVTTKGRHGSGQPVVIGEVIDRRGQHVRIRQDDGTVRVRTISNVRLLQEGAP